MRQRRIESIGRSVSEIGFGAWAIGGAWGKVDDEESKSAIEEALEVGINFFDTADVYGDGHSENLIAEVRDAHGADMFIATKFGRRIRPHTSEHYTADVLEHHLERSRKNLKVDAVDLVQLHCPPTEVYYRPELFEALDQFVEKGLVRHIGVSVERVEEALKAIEYPGVKTVQIIFNPFRQRPKERFFAEAQRRGIGIFARVPLASGLLTGKMTAETEFESDDHRNFNRQGEAFDRGETFAGVPFEVGLEAAEELKKLVPLGTSLAQFTLRWILMHGAVTCPIPGAKRPEQVRDNAAAAHIPRLDEEAMRAVDDLYKEKIAPYVHHRW